MATTTFKASGETVIPRAAKDGANGEKGDSGLTITFSKASLQLAYDGSSLTGTGMSNYTMLKVVRNGTDVTSGVSSVTVTGTDCSVGRVDYAFWVSSVTMKTVKDSGGTSHSVPVTAASFTVSFKYDGETYTATCQVNVDYSVNIGGLYWDNDSLKSSYSSLTGSGGRLETMETSISQNAADIKAQANRVTTDSNGKITNISTSGLVLTSDYSSLFASNVDSTGLVKKASIKTFISTDGAEGTTKMSNVTIEADKINLTGHTMAFNSSQITIDSDNFKLAKDGTIDCVGGRIGCFTISKYTDATSFTFYNMKSHHDGTTVIPSNTVNIDYNGIYVGSGTTTNGGTVRLGHGGTFTNDSPSWDYGVLYVDADFSAGADSATQTGIYCTIEGKSTQTATALSLKATGGKVNHAIDIRGGDVSGYRPVTKAISGSYYFLSTTSDASGTLFICTSAITVYLPSSADNGTTYHFIRAGGNLMVYCANKIYRHGDGSVKSSDTFTSANEWVDCVCYGGYWYVRCSGD